MKNNWAEFFSNEAGASLNILERISYCSGRSFQLETDHPLSLAGDLRTAAMQLFKGTLSFWKNLFLPYSWSFITLLILFSLFHLLVVN